MDWGDVIATAALVVAVAAGLITFRQASDGRKSRRATEQQAIAAEQQAREATRAREIADEALAIAKQTEADRIADRDACDAPEFGIVPSGRTHVRVTLEKGPPDVVVRMARLDIVGQGDNRPGVPITLLLDPQDRRLTRGGSCLLAVDVRIEKSSCSVRIELSSQEVNGSRVWPWRQEVEFPAPPATAMVSAATDDLACRRHEPGF